MRAKPTWHTEAQRLHSRGLSQRTIAERLGKARRTVGKALHGREARLDFVDPDPCIPGLLPIRKRERGRLVIVDFARVDLADWEALHEGRFSFTSGYVTRSDRIRLHHLILPIDKDSGLECDHINRDKLDNRRHNLRAVTPRQNSANRGGMFDREARLVA